MEKEHLFGQMEQYMRVILQMTKEMEKEKLLCQMEEYMMCILKLTKKWKMNWPDGAIYEGDYKYFLGYEYLYL